MKKTFSALLLPVLFFTLLNANAQKPSKNEPPFLKYMHSTWVDSTLASLSPKERIAQLIMVAAYSNRGETHKQEILNLIENQKIGGLIFFQGDAKSQVKLMNTYQAASKTPLLGAIDAEWGLGMRLDNTISFPYQMTLGAIQDNHLIHKMGAEVARQIKRVGLHVNFAPVVDVNNNPNNPVINYRSFGENKERVAKKGIAYMRGMQENQVLATAKHFPGHGDTDTDSHLSLPVISHNIERLQNIELYPFRKVIDAGIGAIMVAHLNIPALDSSGVPSTLSKPIITDLLKEKLNFKGLVVTDAMNMGAITKNYEPGVVDKKAILAGNDLLEFTENVPKAIAEIENALKAGRISQEEIDARVRKILAIKQWAGLNNYNPVSVKNIQKDLHTPQAKLLNRNLMAAALTVLKNEDAILPIVELDSIKIASVSVGAKAVTPFQEHLGLYTKIKHFVLPVKATQGQIEKVQVALNNFDVVIGGIHDAGTRPRNTLKFSPAVLEFINTLSTEKATIWAFFKNPYTLNKIEGIEKASGLIVAYQDGKVMQEVAAELIFGGIGANGTLPVSIGEKFDAGDGLEVTGGIRFSYTSPEAAGMDSKILNTRIDSIMQEAMDIKGIPGGVILVAKDQKVVFHKAYGLHRYSDTIKVEKGDLYDLASVTKISSTMAALMKLYDEGKFRLDQTLATHLPKFGRSNKADIPYRDILTHQARFQPWIPFYKNLKRDNGSYKWWTIKKDSSARYPIKITEDMWLHHNYPDKIVKTIRKTPLLEKKEYVYSDFFFILAPRVVESMVDKDFVSYLQSNFYKPLGGTTITYNPLKKFPNSKIVPTENDFYFRMEPIDGTVHDEGAIMLGGISGHAGLFANANDLAKLMQMYLNMGKYGGKRYIEEATLKEFSSTQFPDSKNKRGLGFDKRRPNSRGVVNNTAPDASKASFGHTGFTGTMVWMDPENNLLYVFLSNRVTPTRENHRIYTIDTRTKIQQVLYDAIK